MILRSLRPEVQRCCVNRTCTRFFFSFLLSVPKKNAEIWVFSFFWLIPPSPWVIWITLWNLYPHTAPLLFLANNHWGLIKWNFCMFHLNKCLAAMVFSKYYFFLFYQAEIERKNNFPKDTINSRVRSWTLESAFTTSETIIIIFNCACSMQ